VIRQRWVGIYLPALALEVGMRMSGENTKTKFHLAGSPTCNSECPHPIPTLSRDLQSSAASVHVLEKAAQSRLTPNLKDLNPPDWSDATPSAAQSDVQMEDTCK
jgi:hypothetical protein